VYLRAIYRSIPVINRVHIFTEINPNFIVEQCGGQLHHLVTIVSSVYVIRLAEAADFYVVK
jgi:hypothetical protein